MRWVRSCQILDERKMSVGRKFGGMDEMRVLSRTTVNHD